MAYKNALGPSSSPLFFPEADNRAWKRSGVFRDAEFQSAFDESNLPSDTVVVPPTCIGTRGKQAKDELSIALRFFVGFTDPFADLPAVWRIHKDPAGPVLFQTIISLCEIAFALRVLRRSAWIKREVELQIESFKEVLRRGPFATSAGDESRVEHCCEV